MPSPMSEFLISTNVPAFAPVAQDGAGAQVGERADGHAVAPTLGAVEVGVQDA